MDNQLLPARIKDLIYLCRKTSDVKFLGFLTPAEASIAVTRFEKHEKYALFGGYTGAERTILAVLPDWCDDPVYPLTAFTFTYRECDTLTHRDFLGSLMALGIARETVGDILVEKGRAVVFVLSDIASFVSSQIEKIGKVGVKISEGFSEPLPSLGKKKEFSTTVASTRLDCVVAELCGFSRKDACNIVADGLVSINSICCEKPTLTLQAGCTVTIRKRGKFEIISCEEHSKKGRVILRYDKYV